MSLTDVFLESKELKRTIVDRSITFKIPLKYICGEIKISYDIFMSAYINTPGVSKLEITEDQIIIMLKILGIDVRYQFVISNNSDEMSVVSKSLADKYEQKVINRTFHDIQTKK